MDIDFLNKIISVLASKAIYLQSNTGNFFRFPFGNFMGLFPTTVKNLGQEIPCMGKYWEVDASHDYTNGFFLGKRFHFTMYPRTGKIL